MSIIKRIKKLEHNAAKNNDSDKAYMQAMKGGVLDKLNYVSGINNNDRRVAMMKNIALQLPD